MPFLTLSKHAFEMSSLHVQEQLLITGIQFKFLLIAWCKKIVTTRYALTFPENKADKISLTDLKLFGQTRTEIENLTSELLRPNYKLPVKYVTYVFYAIYIFSSN